VKWNRTLGLFGQELLNGVGLVSGEIIEHDMDLLGPASAPRL
jgi:hypothetical protein